MTHHIGYIHGRKLEPFSPPCFCQSGPLCRSTPNYYQKGYRRHIGKMFTPHKQHQESLRIAAA